MTTADWIPADSFGLRLIAVRREKGLTVEEAAKACHIATATWSTWERGALPRNMSAVVAKITLALQVNRDWLMWGGPLSPPHEPAVTRSSFGSNSADQLPHLEAA